MGEFAVVVVGLGFVILGLFRYMQDQDKDADKRRKELFTELEVAKLEIVRLKGALAKQRRLKIEARQRCRHYLKLLKKK